MISGRDLRAAREECGLSLRELAQRTGRDPGDLSRRERGEREITPAIVRDYEQVLGQIVAATISGVNDAHEPATVDDVRRRDLGQIAMASVGAAVADPLVRLLDGLDAADLPARVGLPEVEAVEEAADLYMRMDLAHGGGMASTMARSTLRWADGLLSQQIEPDIRSRLSSGVGLLADRLGWATYDVGDSKGALRLLKYALNASAKGADRDLRGHIMLDLSTVVTDSGDPAQAVDILRMALGDERLSSAERANLHAVCARHCGAAGDRAAGLRHVRLSEEAITRADAGLAPAWAHRITVSAGHHDSALGLALFEIGEDDRARQRLTSALTHLGSGRTRTALRCRTRLAVLELRAGDRAEAETQIRRCITDAKDVRSRRILADLTMVMREANALGYHDLATEVRQHLAV